MGAGLDCVTPVTASPFDQCPVGAGYRPAGDGASYTVHEQHHALAEPTLAPATS